MVRRSIIWWIGYLLVSSFSRGNALKKRVCVIGAGPAGLASVKQLADRLEEFEPVVFEKNSDVGGLWLYSDNTGVDQFNLPVHSSMYSNMRHFFKPNIPKIPGIETFPGRVFHSRLYRKAEEFTGQTVLLLGAGTSGPDIAVESSKYAKTVFLSHRRAKIPGAHPPNLIQVASVIAANGSEFTFHDGSKITADVLIYCTGYVHDYPFLDESSGVHLINRVKEVGPLYQYVVNVEHNSMGLIGVIPRSSLSFPMFYLQAQYYVAVLQGKVKLPNRAEMLNDIEVKKSLPRSIFDFEWVYYNEYVKSANIKPLPDYYRTVAKLWLLHLYDERFYYKDYNLHVADEGRLTIYKPKSKNNV